MSTTDPAYFRQLMQSGYAAYAEGHTRRAYSLWRQAAALSPFDEQVWVAMLPVLNDVNDRLVCLQNIVAINPNNQAARSQLDAFIQANRTNQMIEPLVNDRTPSIAQPAPPRMSPLSLRKNFSWTFVGNIVYTGCQWGMLAALAKIGTPEMVGQFALGLTVTAPILTFTDLNLRGVQSTDIKRVYGTGDYLGLRLLMTTLAMLIILGVTILSGFRWETLLVVLAIGVSKSIESVSDVFYGLLQQHERMDRIAKSMIIKGPLSLVTFSLGVYLSGSTLVGVIGLIATWTLVLLAYDIPSALLVAREGVMTHDLPIGTDVPRESLRPRWDRKTLIRLTILALPLGIVMLLVSLNVSIPRYFVERYFGEGQLGIFVALAYLERVSTTVASALGQAASPRMAKYFAAGNGKAFRSLLLRLMGIGAVLGLAIVIASIVAGKEILMLIYKPEYAIHDLFVWLMIASGLGDLASFMGYSMTSARYFAVQLPLFILITIVSLIASVVLIPTMGLIGAAMVLIIAALIRIIAGAIVIIHGLRSLEKQKRTAQ